MPRYEYTREHIKSSKLALLLGSIAAAVADVFVVVLLMIAGLWGYVVLPIILAVADIAFLVVAMFTNFRFRYSIAYTATYLAVFVGCVLGHFFIIYGGEETAMTALALIIWVVVHVLNFLVTLFGAKGAVTKKKSHHFVTALLVIVFIGTVGLYIGYGSSNGYFGQGSLTARPILYVYNEQTKSYTATGVLSGNGKYATIPAEFDGKPVTAIDAGVFNTQNLDRIDIQCAESVKLKNLNTLTEITVTEISAPRDTLTTLQRELYTAYREAEVKNDLLLSLAGCSVPSDLADDEIYITFTYTEQAMACIGEDYLPSWIGKKGDKFDLTSLSSSIAYIKQVGSSNEQLLHTLYEDRANGGGYIMLPIMLDSTTPLDGSTIQKSHQNVTVDFEKIYRVKVAEDNDTLYTMPTEFTSTHVGNNEDVSYRYVTPSTVASLLPSAEQRDGFTLEWEYQYGTNLTLPQATTSSEALLSSLDARGLREFTVSPTWTLEAPVINSLSTNKTSGAFTYGDTVDFTINAAPPTDGINLSYAWYFEDTYQETTDSFTVSPIRMEQAGEYRVVVTASSTSVTSLTSSSEKTLSLTVAKKGIQVNWAAISDATNPYAQTYDRENHEIYVTFNENQFVFEDDFTALSYEYSCNDITFTAENGVKAKNAGSYAVSVSLLGDAADKYTVSNATQSYTIDKKAVDVVWGNATLTYNAAPQAPEASADENDVCAGDTVNITVSGQMTDANVEAITENPSLESYTATASLRPGDGQNDNYRLVTESITKVFTITPKELEVTWTGDSESESDFEYVYTASGQRPVANFTGVLNNQNLELSYSDAEIRANTTENPVYTATVEIGNKNYYVATASIVLSQSFTITPKKLTVSWRGENNSTLDFSWVYDTAEHQPIALFTGLLGSDEVNASYNEVQTEAGDYEATVTVGNTDYYIEDTAATHEFTITKRPITINNLKTSFVYDATAHYPTYAVDNVVEGTDAGFVFVDSLENTFNKQTNVGVYSCTLTITNDNYSFTDQEMSLEITKRPVTITWTTSMVYAGEDQFPGYTLGNVCQGDTYGASNASINLTESGAQRDVGTGYTATLAFESANYSVDAKYLTSTFAITPKSIQINWNTLEFIYNGYDQAPVPTVVSGELFGTDTVTITVSGAMTDANTNSSKYSATATSDNANYSISNNTAQFTIAPYTISSVTWTGEGESTSDFSWIYDGTQRIPVAVAYGVLGEEVTVRVTGGQTNANAYMGTEYYTATATSSNTNYVIETAEDVNTKKFTITQKELTVSWTGENESTDDFAWVYDAQYHIPVAVFDGKVDSDNLNLSYSSTPKNYGHYTATVTVGNKNYYVANENTLSQAFDITARPLTVEWSTSDGFVFDNTAKFPTYTITGFAGSENKSVLSITEYGAQKNAGEHDVYFTYDNSNYYISDADTKGTLYIDRREVTPVFTTTTLTYNGAAQIPTYTWNNTVSGYSYTENVEVSDGYTDVGDGYLFTVSFSADEENYYIAQGNEQTTFSIVPRSITVSWGTSSLTYNGSEQTPTFSTSGILAVDKNNGVELTVSGAERYKGEGYTATVSINSTNYTISNPECAFSIAAKRISLTWNYNAVVYDGNTHSPIATVPENVIASGDTVTAIYLTDSAVNAGTHTMEVESSNENYVFINPTRTYTISKKTVSVTWYGDGSSNSDFEFTYNGAQQCPTASALGVNGEELVTVSGARTNTVQTQGVSSYTATASTTDTNYTLTNTTHTFTIVPKALSITWGDLSFTYDGTAHKPTATVTGGVCIGDSTPTLTYSYSTSSPIAAGTYTVTAGISDSNYALTSEARQTFTIAKAKITVIWENLTYEYDGYSHKPTAYFYDVNGNKQYLTVTLNTTGGSAVAVGSYKATASLTTTLSNNYEIESDATAYFTITN